MIHQKLKALFRVNFYQLLANGMHIGHHQNSANQRLDRYFIGRRYSVIIINLLVSVLVLRRAVIALFGVTITRVALYLLCLCDIILIFFFT